MQYADRAEDQIPDHHPEGHRQPSGLAEGDKLEVREHNGVIQIIPVAVYPKRYLEELRSEIDEAKAKVAAGEQPTFDSVDALFEMLDGAN